MVSDVNLYPYTAGWEKWLHRYTSALHRSGAARGAAAAARRAWMMNLTNPAVTLRAHLAHAAAADAERGDFAELRRLHAVRRCKLDPSLKARGFKL